MLSEYYLVVLYMRGERLTTISKETTGCDIYVMKTIRTMVTDLSNSSAQCIDAGLTEIKVLATKSSNFLVIYSESSFFSACFI